ncbi:hypothetical protein OE88DRAFT_578958 [Heliocybe sulcata]|uniref:Uncharacterized protein n=1 Tax=Heliocybe sulcata TaxID=5364 RepID=A0A5C3MR72_9AGAM|nr:hypothetical protein OE88DRAFT_578958 [Heliocybe sulcata]
MICKLLEHVLSSGVSVLVKKLSRKPARSYSANGKETAARAHATLETALDDILGLVLTGILVPAIRTFAILSRVHIKSFCSAHKRPKKELATIVDIRPDVFCLVDSVLSNLDSLAAHPKPSEKLINCLLNLKEGAALQVVRELDRLYPGADSQAQSINTAGSAQGPSRQERIEALARKDALWYLCNVLSLLADADSKIGSPLEGALAPVNTEAEMELESEKASLLRAAIAAALEMLLKRTNGGSGLQHTSGGRGGMGEMEYGMVLSVLESAWFGGVACKR